MDKELVSGDSGDFDYSLKVAGRNLQLEIKYGGEQMSGSVALEISIMELIRAGVESTDTKWDDGIADMLEKLLPPEAE
jgi:hypothetical protein